MVNKIQRPTCGRCGRRAHKCICKKLLRLAKALKLIKKDPYLMTDDQVNGLVDDFGGISFLKLLVECYFLNRERAERKKEWELRDKAAQDIKEFIDLKGGDSFINDCESQKWIGKYLDASGIQYEPEKWPHDDQMSR